MSEPFELSWVENLRHRRKKHLPLKANLSKALSILTVEEAQLKSLMNNIMEAVHHYDRMKAARQSKQSKTDLRNGLTKLLKASEHLKKASEKLCVSEGNTVIPDINFLLLLDESPYKNNLVSMLSLLSMYGDEVCEDIKGAITKLGHGQGGGNVSEEKILLEEIKMEFQKLGLNCSLTKDHDARTKSEFIQIVEVVFVGLNIRQSLETAINKNYGVKIESHEGVTIFNTKPD